MNIASMAAKQVTTVGSEEKRAITVLVSLTNDGVLLPFQTIYKGSTVGCLPSKDSPGYAESVEAGFLMEPSKTTTYWSTIETMKSFVNNKLAPYYQRTKASLGLPEDQRSVWQIDCWSVHRSDEFLDWMGLNHEMIIIDFVPARLTGLFQPCDVGFQRVFKHSARNSAHEDVVQEVLRKLEDGLSAESMAVDAGIKVLRNRTVGWLWKAYCQLNRPEVIKKVGNLRAIPILMLMLLVGFLQAWEMCRAGEFNLSYESLTSPAARQILRDLPVTDPQFFAELTQPRSRVAAPVLDTEDALHEDAEVSDLDIIGDDSSVPIEAILDAMHGVLPQGSDEMFVEGSDGVVSRAEAEETLIEEVDGVIVDATASVAQAEGRGLRKKFRNKLYEEKALKWWAEK